MSDRSQNDQTIVPEAPASLDHLERTLNLDQAAPPNSTDFTLNAEAPSVEPFNPAADAASSPDFTLNAEAQTEAPSFLDRTLNLEVAAPAPDRTAMLDAPLEASAPSDRTVDLVTPATPPPDWDGAKTAADVGDVLGHTVDLRSGVPILGTTLAAREPKPRRSDETVAPEEGVDSAAEVSISVRTAKPEQVRGLPEIAGYALLGELGRGGMGVVYKARHQQLNRLVALKMILAANRASAKDLARFSIEAEAVAQLVHPNIVQLYEIGERDGCPFFSLEFVPGGSLADRTETHAQPAKRAARIVRALASAMDFAHRRGIIHRDLKPANILLELPENVPQPQPGEPFPLDVCIPKITDFGLAKRLEGDSGQTRDGAIMGTPNYMAPEQAQGKNKNIGPAADIYALGSILYDLLTGTPPFKGSTIMETLNLVVNREPVPPRKLNALIPSDLSTICLKCLEKDPVKRYTTAGDLAEDLRCYLEGEPIHARSSTKLERAVKWARRRPAAAALVGVSVFAVLSMSFGGVAFALNEQQNAATANRLRGEAEEKKEEAQRQRQRAEANFLDACAAVDELLARVGSQRLAHEPRMEKVRRELLQKAHQFYEKFLREAGDDPMVQWQAGRSQQQLGDIERMLGQTEPAKTYYLQAIGLFEKLRGQFPDDVRYREDLAGTQHRLGGLYSETRRFDEAEAAHRSAQALRQQLLQADEGNAAYRRQLADSSYNLGLVYFRRGQFPVAHFELDVALDQLQPLAGTGAPPEVRHERARLLNLLGQTHQQMAHTAAARQAFQHARDELRQLAKEDQSKDVPEYRQELAATLNNLGDLLRDIEPPVAEAAFQEAVQLTQALADDFPATPTYRQDLAANLNTYAVLLQAKGANADAEKYFTQAIAVKRRLALELPWQPDYRRDLVAALNNRGVQLLTENRLDEAGKIYDEALGLIRALLKEHPGSPAYELELSHCLYNQSVLQLQQQHAQPAETLMREALAVAQGLADAHAAVPEYRYELGRTHDLAAELEPVKAEQEYCAAIAAFQPLGGLDPEIPDDALTWCSPIE